LKPDSPRNFIDVGRIANGAIFEGTKGTILADFTSRVLFPSNEDGDLTYYRRRTSDQLMPAAGGTLSRNPPPRPSGRRSAAGLPKGFTAAPNATPGPNGFPAIQFLEGGVPAAIGMPNTTVGYHLDLDGVPGPDPFQKDWIDACKGLTNNAKHGTSSKTHCDFDYAGTMMEQMLLGLVAHRAGKRLEYDPATGRITNSTEANDWLKRTYRPNWKLDG
jgi:hypothetical protein